MSKLDNPQVIKSHVSLKYDIIYITIFLKSLKKYIIIMHEIQYLMHASSLF
jgi:hypothetical protein